MHNELKVLGETVHPNIMKIFELMEDDIYYYIVSEILDGGELYERIVKMKKFDEKDACQIIKQVLLAINYMHNQNIMHRDLKPENILLVSKEEGNLDVKITDFGFACHFKKGQTIDDTLGSPLYMAPEICEEQDYNEKVDIWSIGVIAYILLCGKPPFKGKSKQQIFTEIVHKELDFDAEPTFAGVTEEARDFITQCLDKNYNMRASADKLLHHQWLSKVLGDPNVKIENLHITDNLLEFRRTTTFQSGVMSFLVHLKTSQVELDELKQLFLTLDTSNDGVLQAEEVEAGIRKLFGKVYASGYQEVMKTIDRDGNGTIDYDEFITACIDKQKLVN